MKHRWLALGAIFVALLGTRLTHARIVWVEEAYPAAAAIQMADWGKTLYRDIWFDKPGGTAYLYLLWGAHLGVPLRVAGAVFIFLCCLLIYRFGCAIWGEREGLAAAALLAFYLTFGIPAAVMALAPDLVLTLPHIACVYLAYRGKAFWSGVVAGLAFWVNTKALFVALAALLFIAPEGGVVRFFIGLLAGLAPQAIWLIINDLIRYWLDQVWRWGAMYARDSFVEGYGIRQTLNWCGFQATLVLGLILGLRRWRFAGWLVLSLIPVALGMRFFPRYYFQLLPVCVLIAGRVLVTSRWRWVMVAAMAIPLVRFGPRYVTLTTDLMAGRPHAWSDLALADDSERVSKLLPQNASLFVWGYRPDIYARTRLKAATRFLDSQPLSGVIADRHLVDDHVSAPEWKERFRETRLDADYVVDGLGLLNPKLAIPQSLLANQYEPVANTGQSIIYRRLSELKSQPNSPK